MTAGRPSPEGPSEDWAVVLEEMEGEVLAAKESLDAGRNEDIAAWSRRTADWTPPSQLGRLPLDLRERAARLLQHQLAVAEELAERILQSRQQRDLAARMSYARTRPAAAFVDRAM